MSEVTDLQIVEDLEVGLQHVLDIHVDLHVWYRHALLGKHVQLAFLQLGLSLLGMVAVFLGACFL